MIQDIFLEASFFFIFPYVIKEQDVSFKLLGFMEETLLTEFVD